MWIMPEMVHRLSWFVPNASGFKALQLFRDFAVCVTVRTRLYYRCKPILVFVCLYDMAEQQKTWKIERYCHFIGVFVFLLN